MNLAEKRFALAVDLLGYLGLALTMAAALVILLKFTGIINSPTFEQTVSTFIVGQAFYNGYILATLKHHSH